MKTYHHQQLFYTRTQILTQDMTVAVLSRWLLQFNQLQIDFNNGIQTHGLCVSAAVLCHWSYEDRHTLGAGQFVDFIEILTRERNET